MRLQTARLLLAGSLLLAFQVDTAGAQSPALNHAVHRHDALQTRDRSQAALPFANQTVELNETESGTEPRHKMNVIRNLPVVYDAQGRHAESTLIYQRALPESRAGSESFRDLLELMPDISETSIYEGLRTPDFSAIWIVNYRAAERAAGVKTPRNWSALKTMDDTDFSD